jgi:hypothetical protein
MSNGSNPIVTDIFEDDPHLWSPPVVKDGDAELFNRMLDAVLVLDAAKEEAIDPKAKTFRTSLVSTEPCRRMLVMRMVYPHPTPNKMYDARVAAIFDDGHWRHHRIQSWMSKLQANGRYLDGKGKKRPVIEAEDLMVEDAFHDDEDGMRQSGHIDVVVRFQLPKLKHLGWVLLELKGIKSTGFAELRGPKRAHFLQAQIYMHKSRRKGRAVNWAFIVYENKDTHDRKVYKIAYLPKYALGIEQDLKVLNGFVNRLRKHPMHPKPGDLPPQEIASWCTRCAFKDQCFDLAERGV